MRCTPVFMLAALLLGAVPALAQESSGAMPVNKQPAAAAAAKNAALSAKSARRDKPAHPKAAAKKPLEAKTAKPGKAKAAVVKLPTPRPEPAKAEAKSAEVKLPAARPEPVKTTGSIEPAQLKATAKANAAPDAFAGIPPAERLRIQAALLWSGDYPGAGNGDDPMLTAIKNFQKRSKASITGTLTAAERARLLAAAHEHEQEFGWSVVVDPATGIRIGLPVKMVPHAREAARGTRWSSAHGEVQVETFRIVDANLKLSELFERGEEGAGQPQGRIPACCATIVSSSAACRG